MKILYFTRSQSPHDLRFLTALAESGLQTAVLCLEGSGKYTWPRGITELSWRGGKNSTNWVRNFRLSREFKRVVAEFQPDVIHAGPIPQVAFIAALARVRPLLSMSWGSDLLLEAGSSPYNRRITRLTLSRTTMLAADCQTVVEKARDFGYTGSIVVFPWGVDLQHFHPGQSGALRERLGWQEKCVFLSNRTLEPLYGVDIVAEAFARASQKDDSLRLMMFGKGSQENLIHAILKEAEKAGKVYYGGYAGLNDLPDIYRSADIYLSASHSDGSSVSLMEALACGTPVLISDIPSNREWMNSSTVGWLFRDGSVEGLAGRMTEVHSKEELRILSGNARLLAEERADWKKNFGLLLDAYQWLVNAETHSK